MMSEPLRLQIKVAGDWVDEVMILGTLDLGRTARLRVITSLGATAVEFTVNVIERELAPLIEGMDFDG